MSNPTPPASTGVPIPAGPASSFTLTGNAALDSAIGLGLFGAASAGASWAVTNLAFLHHMDTTTLSLGLFAVLAGAATAVWKYLNSRANTAKAVQAGMTLALSGEAILQSVDGVSIPKPVTTSSAAQIVKDYGDAVVTIPNAAEVTKALEPTTVLKG